MTAVLETYASKPVMQDSAVQVPVNHLPDIRAIKAMLPLETVFIDLFEDLSMILHTLVVGRGDKGSSLRLTHAKAIYFLLFQYFF